MQQFGQNEHGQLGLGSAGQQRTPALSESCCEKDVVYVAAGNEQTAVLTNTGEVKTHDAYLGKRFSDWNKVSLSQRWGENICPLSPNVITGCAAVIAGGTRGRTSSHGSSAKRCRRWRKKHTRDKTQAQEATRRCRTRHARKRVILPPYTTATPLRR